MSLYNGIRNIDHPAIVSRDLDSKRVQFERLGLIVY
jgi:hypothetical protein